MRRRRGLVPTFFLILSLAVAIVYVGFFRPPKDVAEDPAEPASLLATVPAPAPAPERDPAPPQAPPTDDAFDRARRFVESRDFAAARPAVAEALRTATDANARRQLLNWGLTANEALVYGDPPAADIETYRVRQGDTLTVIARRQRTSVGAIKFINGMTNDNLRADRNLRIPRGRFSLLAVKSAFRLYVLYEGAPLVTYEIAIGAENQTPCGTYTVGEKTGEPTWFVPPEVQQARNLPPVVRYGDPNNPLGTHWIGLNHPRYQGLGIHGTNDPASIGTRATLGCIRLRNEDVARVFELVTEGMDVAIVE